ncbi:carbohydrate esterase family 4 protein [Mucor ambiguus]|uniref:Carbohydrate esterase family 4 protein n=1 Tax=Mucor ambiguus TaxID=91626 RepID=A0A0C9MFI7_9FUNG|nr:carbohydrate esterase family 4 protein [Mucor ambiguus]
MKYILAATVLSCLVISNAEANVAAAINLKSEVAAATISAIEATGTSTTIQDSVDSLSSVGYAIKVPGVDGGDDDGDENSPALPAIPEEEEDDEEEDEDEEEQEVVVDIGTRESAYAGAGLKYNKDVDLPVLAQRKQLEGEDLPAVPQVIACRTDGQVAITYSEGPSDATARIARQLNNAQVKASFFVNTKWLQEQQYAMVLQNIYNAGHLIGLTYRLPTEDPETMSDEEIKADIITHAKMVESLIHVSPKYVRLHFSAQSDGRTEHILQELGFVLVGYNLDGKDYVHKTPELIEQEYQRTFKSYRAAHQDKKGSFVAIQYDIPETGSMVAVPNVIQLLQREGYDAVRMDGCLNDEKPYKASAAGLEYVGDKFSLGSAGYKSGQKITSVINNSTSEEEIRGLSADDGFLNESAGALAAVPNTMGLGLIPAAFAYALLCLL